VKEYLARVHGDESPIASRGGGLNLLAFSEFRLMIDGPIILCGRPTQIVVPNDDDDDDVFTFF